MKITIIADASYCHETQAGGFGFWIASERGKYGGGGPFRKRCDGSAAAEMMAVVNAFAIAINRKTVQEGDHVLLQTDCVEAIAVLSHRRRGGTADQLECIRVFRQLKKEAGVTVSFRHVKGHTRHEAARFVTNNLCDRRAKAGMRAMRKQLQEGTIQ